MGKKPEYWCPRRAETGSTAYGPDSWPKQDGARRCSYCGSMHPDDFMTIARGDQPGELGPTDKSYKVYVTGSVHAFVKFYFQHLSVEQQTEFIDLYNRRPRRAYTDDLQPAEALQPEWAHPVSSMLIGYPGRFYTPPYFMTAAQR